MAGAMQNLRGNSIFFCHVLNQDKLEGAFQNGNHGIFLLLLNEHRRNQEVLINIE